MLRAFLLLFILCFLIRPLHASVIKGKVFDNHLNEELVGATILIKELQTGTTTGLDGSYIIKDVPEGNYTIICRFISYQSIEKQIKISKTEILTLNFNLVQVDTELEGVSILAYRDKSTDLSARSSERNSSQVINVVSAKTIELSPDLNVANVLQRMSGVTLDKGTSGSGQYAILRGMDKRYSYTLVNGIKIPSTHNKHRYVSLDMFPSDMVDRVEVTKALTPDMEGDAIAGAINMIMKNAPDKLLVQASASTGYSLFFTENDFLTFNTDVLNPKSPYERNESGYRAVPSDFSSENLLITTISLPINYTANVTVGNRFFDKKLGWILSGSYQNLFSGENSLYFNDGLSRDGQNLPVLTSMQERIYTSHKKNAGIHNKLDYQFNKNHRLQLYAAYLNNDETQVREVQHTNLTVSYDPDAGNINRSHSTRFRKNTQSLFNATLQGDHQLSEKLSVQWSAVYSNAQNHTPEEAIVEYANGIENYIPVRQYVDFDGSTRIWRRNSDTDKAGYLNLTYMPEIFGIKTEITAGGLYRQKDRTSFYNKYTLNAIVNVSNSDTSYTSFYSEKGVDWDTYNEILWKVYNPRGTIATGENYDAYENVIAGYGMFRFAIDKLQVTVGIRFENTDQGYYMQYPIGEPEPEGNQIYTDVLPSIHFKYSRSSKQNLRLSYYRAINKPGFQEIVPYIDASEEPASAGNKNLKHAIADNIDLRWEYFPTQLDQVMAGLFYKNIKDPIEYAFDKFMNVSQNIVYMPVNSDKAVNYGLEIDVVKYYRQFGIKGNYTYTHSGITSQKLSRVKDENNNDSTAYVSQTRPLFGQSANVGNISLLYKGTSNGISTQIAFSYTGDRIYTVSRYIDNDQWQKAFWQMDASAEKRFENGISVYFKAQNLLNSHVKVYIKKTNPINSDVPYHADGDENTLVRDEYSAQSFLIGIRYKL
jgi:TonB-dependent receptor